MKKIFLLAFLIPAFTLIVKAQTSDHIFDTVQFSKELKIANHLIEYEFYTQLSKDKYSKIPETFNFEWFSYKDNNIWHSVGGNSIGNAFVIKSDPCPGVHLDDGSASYGANSHLHAGVITTGCLDSLDGARD